MYDLEAAADRLKRACYQGDGDVNDGPKEFTFFILDSQMGGGGFFCWYETREQLLQAIKLDLVGFMYAPEESEDDEPAEFLKRVADVVERTPESKRLEEPMRKRIDNLLLSPWQMPYIGTYSQLLSGSGEWEQALRSQFRNAYEFDDEEPALDDDTAPITSKERSAFDAFITSPVE